MIPDLPLWPTAIYPIVMSGLLYTLYFYNQQVPLQTVVGPSMFSVLGVFYLAAAIVDVAIVLFTIAAIGWEAIPVVVVGAAVVYGIGRHTLGLIPMLQYVGPSTYVGITCVYVDYIGRTAQWW